MCVNDENVILLLHLIIIDLDGYIFPFSRSFRIMVFWVFGYGSLVWNPGFEFDEKIIGYIKDYKRVFDLGKFRISSKRMS